MTRSGSLCRERCRTEDLGEGDGIRDEMVSAGAILVEATLLAVLRSSLIVDTWVLRVGDLF